MRLCAPKHIHKNVARDLFRIVEKNQTSQNFQQQQNVYINWVFFIKENTTCEEIKQHKYNNEKQKKKKKKTKQLNYCYMQNGFIQQKSCKSKNQIH